MCVLSRDSRKENFHKVRCVGMWRSFDEFGGGIVESQVALGATWPVPGRTEPGADWADVRGAFRQAPLWDL